MERAPRRGRGLWVDLGREGYLSTLRLQEELRALRQDGAIPDTFLVVEHPPCLTIGRGGSAANILAGEDVLARAGIAVYVADRGGDVTYHGPGQLVCYPIVDLTGYGRDLHAHARRLEGVMMEAAASFGVASWRTPGSPGVWTARGKVGAIGVAVRRWVTTHGAALNACPDMKAFSLIVPCGLRGMTVTSLAEIKGHAVDLALVRAAMRASCEEVFGLPLTDTRRRELVRVRPAMLAC